MAKVKITSTSGQGVPFRKVAKKLPLHKRIALGQKTT